MDQIELHTIGGSRSSSGILLNLVISIALVAFVWISGKRLWLKHQQWRTKQRLPKIQPLHNYDYRTQKPNQLRPFKPIYHITMGIQSEGISDLITVDAQYFDRVTLRREIIAQYRDTVHGCLPGGEATVAEVYSYLLSHHLPGRFPDSFKINGKNFENRITNQSFPLNPPQDPELCLRILGETVEEDIFLLKETDTVEV